MLEFKLKGDEARFTDVLGWWASKAAAEHGESEPQAQDEQERPVMSCPYCGQASPAQEFLHGDHRAYFRRVALREIAEPMVFGLFDEIDRMFSGLRSGPVTVRVEHGSRGRSPRPFSGPEANDMVRVACARCDEHFKLYCGWSGTVRCPSCSSELRLG